MLAQLLSVGRVVESDHNGIVMNANVPIKTLKQAVGKMGRLPGAEGRTQTLAQPVNDGLGHQRHAYLAVANVQVQRAPAVPAQGLVGIKEFFDVPALGIVGDQLNQLSNNSELSRFEVFGDASDELVEALKPLGAKFRTRTIGMN